MSRELPEWIGRDDNERVPTRVQLRVYLRQNGICPCCGRLLRPAHWDTDHTVALINGGQNRESNLRAVCSTPCHGDKTRMDMAEKSHSYERRLSHAGIKRKGRSFATNRDGRWKKKIDGTVERR